MIRNEAYLELLKALYLTTLFSLHRRLYVFVLTVLKKTFRNSAASYIQVYQPSISVCCLFFIHLHPVAQYLEVRKLKIYKKS